MDAQRANLAFAPCTFGAGLRFGFRRATARAHLHAFHRTLGHRPVFPHWSLDRFGAPQPTCLYPQPYCTLGGAGLLGDFRHRQHSLSHIPPAMLSARIYVHNGLTARKLPSSAILFLT